jgi:hypothetical protein
MATFWVSLFMAEYRFSIISLNYLSSMINIYVSYYYLIQFCQVNNLIGNVNIFVSLLKKG